MDKINKYKKIIALVLLFVVVFVSTAHAILWVIAGLVRAGAVAVGTFISTPLGKFILRSAVNHVIAGGIAYWFLDRGSGAPPAERYVQVDLSNTQAAVQKMKDSGSILQNTMSTSAYTASCGNGKTCTSGTPAGSILCWDSSHTPYATAFCTGTEAQSQNCISAGAEGMVVYSTGYQQGAACNGTLQSAYAGSEASKDKAVSDIWADSTKYNSAIDGLGMDIQKPATLTDAPITGEPVTVIGTDGQSIEFPSGTTDEEIRAWLGNGAQKAPSGDGGTSTTYGGPTAAQIGTAVNAADTYKGPTAAQIGTAVNSSDTYKGPSASSIGSAVGSAVPSASAIGTGVKDAMDADGGTYTGGDASGHSDFTKPNSNIFDPIKDNTNNFLASMKQTSLFALPDSLSGSIPSGGTSTLTINGGSTFGVHNYDFADKFATVILILRGVFLVGASYIAVRIITKGGH